MADTLPTRGLELRSTISTDGQLTLELVEVDVPAPAADQVLVRLEAAPISPSDLALLLGPIDGSTLAASGTKDRPVVTARIPPQRLPALAARFDQSMQVGNEGAGTVIAGDPKLVGKRVSLATGGTFAQYRIVRARDCLVLPEGVTARQGAAAFVNPMTVLSMLETMRADKHTAIVHTAAASNLGQMLVRATAADKIPLVNIVRSAEQVALLRSLGAEHVLDSTVPAFREQLIQAVAATGATLAFDAIGGGALASQILGAMEMVAVRQATGYSRYGSSVHKQVYIYGRLDLRPTELDASAGLSWGVAGWLLPSFLAKAGMETVVRLRARVLAELTTTFASNYTAEIGLAQILDLDTVRAYTRRATGAKYLVTPAS
ncbi:MAG: zinc-binding dehydrogenase [Deltaproteobacteria bacterium]|nr:zinc-binding dehydrogenase [Deltaproteobacteria bacterium]